MNSLEDHVVTEENFLAYAGVCLDLAIKLPEVHRKKHAFDTLIIPSRGAVPFFSGMIYASDKLRDIDEDCSSFYDDMGIQSTLAPLLPENSKVSEQGVYNKNVRVLLAPFTADLNVERAFPGEDNDEYVKKTREYWARVTAAMFLPPDERGSNSFFKTFTKTVLRTIEKRPEVAELYELFPQINRTAIMDTVISGRAATDILTSFEQLSRERSNPNLVPYAFLIVDKNGTRMQPKFKTYLQRQSEYNNGTVSFFNAGHIISEDKGSSLLGMGAVVYPTVMKASKEFECGGKEFFVGAGSWYPAYELGDSNIHNFREFMKTVYHAISYRFAKDFIGDGKKELDAFKDSVGHYVAYAKQNRVFLNSDHLDLRTINLNPKYKPADSYETKSFVGHIVFNEHDTQSIVNSFWQFPDVFKKDNPLSPSSVARIGTQSPFNPKK